MECKNMVYSIRITLYKINGSGIYTHNLCYMVLEISSTCSHAIGNILDFRYSDLEYTNWILLLGHISRAYLKDTQTFNPLFLTCSFLYYASSGAPCSPEGDHPAPWSCGYFVFSHGRCCRSRRPQGTSSYSQSSFQTFDRHWVLS